MPRPTVCIRICSGCGGKTGSSPRRRGKKWMERSWAPGHLSSAFSGGKETGFCWSIWEATWNMRPRPSRCSRSRETDRGSWSGRAKIQATAERDGSILIGMKHGRWREGSPSSSRRRSGSEKRSGGKRMDPEEIKIEGPVSVFPWRPGDDPSFLITREWLTTNGLGGYASGTLLGIPSRRYHGLFIPNLPSPRGRTMMLPRLDEEVETASRKARLSGAQFVDGKIGGESHLFLKEFRHEWQTPTWIFEIDGHILEKRVCMP